FYLHNYMDLIDFFTRTNTEANFQQLQQDFFTRTDTEANFHTIHQGFFTRTVSQTNLQLFQSIHARKRSGQISEWAQKPNISNACSFVRHYWSKGTTIHEIITF